VRVVDGDTVVVKVDGREETVRLIGIDTPETVDPRKLVECFGREASGRAKELLAVGGPIELEADSSQGERDSTPSRRLLRYVWLPDGEHVNLQMVREGYAHEYTYRVPYKYQAEFRAAEREARDQRRGLWAPETCNGDTKQPAPAAPAPGPPPTATAAPVPTSTPRPPTATVAATMAPPATATRIPPASATARAAALMTPSTASRPRVVFEDVRGAGPNQRASVTVRVDPPGAGIECTLRYVAPAGTNSEANGVGTKPTGRDGRVSWSWQIGGRTGAGTGKVYVRCGDSEEVTADIPIS
jgi:micrococcal nuclease